MRPRVPQHPDRGVRERMPACEAQRRLFGVDAAPTARPIVPDCSKPTLQGIIRGRATTPRPQKDDDTTIAAPTATTVAAIKKKKTCLAWGVVSLEESEAIAVPGGRRAVSLGLDVVLSRQTAEQVNRQQKHQRRVVFRSDLRRRLQIPQRHCKWLLGNDLGSFGKLGGSLELAPGRMILARSGSSLVTVGVQVLQRNFSRQSRPSRIPSVVLPIALCSFS